MALRRAGDQFLVAAMTVGVRAVEEIDADLARVVHRIDRRISVGLIIERRHRRTAEPDRRDLEPTEPAPLHPYASSTTRINIVRSIIAVKARVCVLGGTHTPPERPPRRRLSQQAFARDRGRVLPTAR